jgi:uncharacterized protein YndB with AHSA1/START domain
VTLGLEFSRLIDAAPEEVFDAFSEQRGQEAFYREDAPGWIVESQCDFRVGGVWTVDFGPSRSELYQHRHVFEVIERPHQIVLTTTETRLDGSSFVTRIEFTFEAQAGKTLMTMAHTGFPTVELRDEHARGVPRALARLRAFVRSP